MPLSLQRKVGLGFTLALVVLLAIGGVAYRGVRQMQAEGFHLAFRADATGTVRAVAGYRYYDKFFSGKISTSTTS